MDIRIVDFVPEHYKAMTLRAEDAADLAGIDKAVLFDSWQGGRTLFVNGEVAFFYGAVARMGTGSLWAVTSPQTQTVPLLATRLAKSMIRALLKSGCHRIEATCHVANARSLAWLTRSLGFVVEGVMRSHGPNRQDRYLLAIVGE